MQTKVATNTKKLAGVGLSAAMLAPTLAGCGGAPQQTSVAPPPGAAMQRQVGQQSGGLSTKQKVALVAGAAALYYLYNKRKNAAAAQGNAQTGRYFLSKNGRVYYRDLQTGKFQYVSPPAQPLQIPEAEARQYNLERFQGFNNAQQGQQFGGYGYQSQSRYDNETPAIIGSF